MVASLHVGFVFDEIAGLGISWLSLSLSVIHSFTVDMKQNFLALRQIFIIPFF
jgi:hypothetical protein